MPRLSCALRFVPLLALAGLTLCLTPARAETKVVIGVGVSPGFYAYHGHGWHSGYRPHYRAYAHRHYRGHVYVLPGPVVFGPPPVYGVPVVPAPVYGGPIYGAPVYGVPVVPAPAYGGSYCREFQTQVKIDNKLQPAWGTACLQPDGTWQFVDHPVR